jgi:hypothetical protein
VLYGDLELTANLRQDLPGVLAELVPDGLSMGSGRIRNLEILIPFALIAWGQRTAAGTVHEIPSLIASATLRGDNDRSLYVCAIETPDGESDLVE